MLAHQIIDSMTGYVPLEDFHPDTETSYSAGIGAQAKTVLILREFCDPQAKKCLKVNISCIVLILDSKETEDDSVHLAMEIAETARSSAAAHACSSVLAGHASESDEYADIGLWLSANSIDLDAGEEGLAKNAKAVLSSLGLDSLLSSEIKPLSISEETHAPVAFRASAEDTDVQRLTGLLGKLSHRFAFCVPAGDVVFHFMLGQAPEKGAWIGLLGVGTWSD